MFHKLLSRKESWIIFLPLGRYRKGICVWSWWVVGVEEGCILLEGECEFRWRSRYAFLISFPLLFFIIERGLVFEVR